MYRWLEKKKKLLMIFLRAVIWEKFVGCARVTVTHSREMFCILVGIPVL